MHYFFFKLRPKILSLWETTILLITMTWKKPKASNAVARVFQPVALQQFPQVREQGTVCVIKPSCFYRVMCKDSILSGSSWVSPFRVWRCAPFMLYLPYAESNGNSVFHTKKKKSCNCSCVWHKKFWLFTFARFHKNSWEGGIYRKFAIVVLVEGREMSCL